MNDTHPIRVLSRFPLAADAAGAKDLPRRMKILDWGENRNCYKSMVVVGRTLLERLADPDCPFSTVALDFEHNTCPGTQAYKESGLRERARAGALAVAGLETRVAREREREAAEYYRVAQTLEGDALKNAPPFVFAESCPQRMADEIKKQTGIDATGYPVKVDVGHARHTEIRHGEHGQADHSMDPESFARTRYVLDHFETCEPAMKNGKPHLNDNYRNSENKPSPQLQFRMRIDGQAVVQEAVQDAKNKVVWIVSSFREPSAAEKEAKAARRAFFREWGKKKASQGKS